MRTRAGIPRLEATCSVHLSGPALQTSVRSTTPSATSWSLFGKKRYALRAEPHGNKTDLPCRRDVQKTLHLANDKTARLDCAVPVREVRSEWIVEMEDQLHTTVPQNYFRQRAIDSAIAFQRPDGFYEQCECRMDRIFAIARLTHCIVDLKAFASLDSSRAFLVNPNARLYCKSTGRCADPRNA